MLFLNRNKKQKNIEKPVVDFMLSFYLNQRFVYDMLAIMNDGFTEFYEIKDSSAKSSEIGVDARAGIGTDNSFALINTSVEGGMKSSKSSNKSNEKQYKKTHTPTSLFMQVYNYLKVHNKITYITNLDKIDEIKSGDFVELKSKIEINTFADFFDTFDKVIDITDAFTSFNITGDPETKKVKSSLYNFKKPVENVSKVIKNDNDKIKYGTCKVADKDLVLKFNKDYFINSDYTEIKNGEFRIIGKVLEVVPEGEEVLLNRENAIGVYDPETFEPVKKAVVSISNMNIEEFKDKVEGKTLVIMPIAIGV